MNHSHRDLEHAHAGGHTDLERGDPWRVSTDACYPASPKGLGSANPEVRRDAYAPSKLDPTPNHAPRRRPQHRCKPLVIICVEPHVASAARSGVAEAGYECRLGRGGGMAFSRLVRRQANGTAGRHAGRTHQMVPHELRGDGGIDHHERLTVATRHPS